jgi:hypothetical protein
MKHLVDPVPPVGIHGWAFQFRINLIGAGTAVALLVSIKNR